MKVQDVEAYFATGVLSQLHYFCEPAASRRSQVSRLE
jgi:hypothetical protein